MENSLLSLGRASDRFDRMVVRVTYGQLTVAPCFLRLFHSYRVYFPSFSFFFFRATAKRN